MSGTDVARWWARALRARWALRGCARVGRDVEVLGRVWVHGGGRVVVGDGVVLDGRTVPIELHAEPGAELVLEDGVRVEGGASLEAHERVVIGAGAVLGGYCKVLDNHFHPLTGNRHERPASQPVVLEPGVVLGWRAIVLPGAVVKRGTVVGSGVVVRAAPRRSGAGEGT